MQVMVYLTVSCHIQLDMFYNVEGILLFIHVAPSALLGAQIIPQYLKPHRQINELNSINIK